MQPSGNNKSSKQQIPICCVHAWGVQLFRYGTVHMKGAAACVQCCTVGLGQWPCCMECVQLFIRRCCVRTWPGLTQNTPWWSSTVGLWGHDPTDSMVFTLQCMASVQWFGSTRMSGVDTQVCGGRLVEGHVWRGKLRCFCKVGTSRSRDAPVTELQVAS
jgi:hypothetical protein